MTHLLNVLNATDPRAVLQSNLERLDTSAAFMRTPSLVNGQPTPALGPPTAGAFTTGELWTDAACGLWRCTVAGAPGGWVQLEPAPAATFPEGAIPDGYQVARSDEHGKVYYYDSDAQLWQEVSPALPLGSLRFDANGDLWLKCGDQLYRKLVGVLVDGVATLTLGDETQA